MDDPRLTRFFSFFGIFNFWRLENVAFVFGKQILTSYCPSVMLEKVNFTNQFLTA